MTRIWFFELKFFWGFWKSTNHENVSIKMVRYTRNWIERKESNEKNRTNKETCPNHATTFGSITFEHDSELNLVKIEKNYNLVQTIYCFRQQRTLNTCVNGTLNSLDWIRASGIQKMRDVWRGDHLKFGDRLFLRWFEYVPHSRGENKSHFNSDWPGLWVVINWFINCEYILRCESVVWILFLG